MSWVTRNFGWKLSSLALASLIYVAMHIDPPVATSIAVPVQYRNIPRELERSEDAVDRVQLEVRGPSGRLSQASLADTAVVLDLSTVAQPGERTFPVQEAQILLPPGVTLQRSVPNQIRLFFEKRLVRDVPVEIRIGTPPPPGYVVFSQRVEPPRLRVVGPERRVGELSVVETDPLDLGGVVGSARFSVHAYISDPRVRFETSGRVTAIIEVRKSEPPED
ncbi:MAG: YbbR-like domain-containing protein [Acidimicrobiia bacterium]|nr:YbbR-like domain-containing protein [Acidimicrobiia bacterium]